jgi:exodeoxyribonuclease-5
LRQLRRQCRERAFVAPRQDSAQVEVCSLSDALGGAVHGLWVMGLNEGAWPPAPRPNPLLPTELQRRAGISSARADSLAIEAEAVQALWCESAAEVVFSWAQSEGERLLRPSPLLAGMTHAEPSAVVSYSGYAAAGALARVDDSRAPAVGPNERIRGGTSLLAAQAVCPAWSFYQYRLGAALLPAPTFGLDARARGALMHAALEAFWRGRGLADLTRMDGNQRASEIHRGVILALDEYEQRAPAPLTPRLRQLEDQRLRELLGQWLEFEAERPNFRVLACEERHRLDIEGLSIGVVIDRLDALDDGRLVLIDYKSGRSSSADSWAAERISEPQLPIYAALAFPDQAVAVVALARVTRDEPAFLGVAQSAGLLPGVKALAEQGKRYAQDQFPDWDALRRIWAERIREIACEVRDGTAATVFNDEKDLNYCEVKPLLRVAERRQQIEEAGE